MTCFGISEEILAAGLVEGDIVLCDLKSGKIIGTISDYHHDSITSINFSLHDKKKMIVGSDDGILCTYNLGEEDIQECVDSMINLENSIFSADFIDQACEKGYAVIGDDNIHMLDFTTDLIVNRMNLYDGTQEQKEYLGMLRAMDESLIYFMNKSSHINIHKITGEKIGYI